MEASRLRLVSENDSPFPWPDDNGELLTTEQAVERVKGLLYENVGLTKLTKKQARENARLEKRVAEDEDPMNHAKGADIVALFDRWALGSNHLKAKLGGPRVKLVKARLKDGYDITGDGSNGATLELAIDGICAYPFQVYDKRNATGRPQDRRDDFELALKDEKHVEALARLGWKARSEGWTPEEGWPDA